MMSQAFHEDLVRQRYADMLRSARHADMAALLRAEEERTSPWARAFALIGRLPHRTRTGPTYDLRRASV
jgi:hypothetical protein